MPGLSTITQSLQKNVYAPIATNLSKVFDKTKELCGRIYQFVLGLFSQIKESTKAALTKVLEGALSRMGNPTAEKVRQLEADLIVKGNALSVVKKEYEDLLAHPTIEPMTPLPGVPADINKKIALLQLELGRVTNQMAKEQANNAQLRGELQGLTNIRSDLQLEQAKVGNLTTENKRLLDEISRLTKQLKATDPLTNSGTF